MFSKRKRWGSVAVVGAVSALVLAGALPAHAAIWQGCASHQTVLVKTALVNSAPLGSPSQHYYTGSGKMVYFTGVGEKVSNNASTGGGSYWTPTSPYGFRLAQASCTANPV